MQIQAEAEQKLCLYHHCLGYKTRTKTRSSFAKDLEDYLQPWTRSQSISGSVDGRGDIGINWMRPQARSKCIIQLGWETSEVKWFHLILIILRNFAFSMLIATLSAKICLLKLIPSFLTKCSQRA